MISVDRFMDLKTGEMWRFEWDQAVYTRDAKLVDNFPAETTKEHLEAYFETMLDLTQPDEICMSLGIPESVVVYFLDNCPATPFLYKLSCWCNPEPNSENIDYFKKYHPNCEVHLN